MTDYFSTPVFMQPGAYTLPPLGLEQAAPLNFADFLEISEPAPTEQLHVYVPGLFERVGKVASLLWESALFPESEDSPSDFTPLVAPETADEPHLPEQELSYLDLPLDTAEGVNGASDVPHWSQLLTETLQEPKTRALILLGGAALFFLFRATRTTRRNFNVHVPTLGQLPTAAPMRYERSLPKDDFNSVERAVKRRVRHW